MGCPQRRDLPVRGWRWGGAPASGPWGRGAAPPPLLPGAPEGAPPGARASARRWVRAPRRRPRAPLPGRPRASLHVFEFRQEALAEMMSADVENGMVPSDATSEFLRRVYELPAGERLPSCIQCGMCSGSCPLGYAMEYTPRKMMAALRAGGVEDLYRSASVWLCVSCY